MADIDWTDATVQVTDHFTVKDALFLHSWGRLATEADGANFDTILATMQMLEQVRLVLDCPVTVHCTFRSQAYNHSQNITPVADVHSQGLAVDFDTNDTMSTDDVKTKLMPVLESMGIRMEDNGAGASWVHVDRHAVGHARFFKP